MRQGIGPHRRSPNGIERLADNVKYCLARQPKGVASIEGVLAVHIVVAPPSGGQLEGCLAVLIAPLTYEQC